MGKKFEGAYPTPENIVAGYRLLGLIGLLGEEGDYTAFEFAPQITDHDMMVYCVPGSFNDRETRELLRDAGLIAA